MFVRDHGPGAAASQPTGLVDPRGTLNPADRRNVAPIGVQRPGCRAWCEWVGLRDARTVARPDRWSTPRFARTGPWLGCSVMIRLCPSLHSSPTEGPLVVVPRLHMNAWEGLIAAVSDLGQKLIAYGGRHSELTPKDAFYDVLSPADLFAERQIIDILRNYFPSDGILCEEGVRAEGTSGAHWVVDPIDGTVNYSKGDVVWGICLGRVINNVVERAVLVFPELNVVAHAVRGHGAFVNDRALPQPVDAEPSDWVICMKFGMTPNHRTDHAQLAGTILQTVRDVRRSGSTAWDLLQIARGVCNGYLGSDVFIWDYAPATALLYEVGLGWLDHLAPGDVRTASLVVGPEPVITWLQGVCRNESSVVSTV